MVSRKHVLTRGLTLALLLLTRCASASASQFAGGTGEPNDPYQIATAEQLIAIGADPNLLDKHFVLIADIDLDPNLPGGRVFDNAVISPWTPPSPGTAWDPSTLFFNGTFDGDGHIIRNFTVEGKPGQEEVGLFGNVHWYGCIRNLRLEDLRVRGGNGVGGLVGSCSGALVACRVTGSVHGDDAVGLLAGFCHGSVKDCTVEGTVSGQTNVGGLVGHNTAELTGCECRGRVVGTDFVGGLAGLNWNTGRVVMCVSKATVTGTRSTGGLVGRNGKEIVYSYAGAVVSGQDCVGGLTGENGFLSADIVSPGTVAYCYALGRVSGRDKVGGLVGSLGSNSQIEECYAASRTDGDTNIGGLVGAAAKWRTTVLRSFWDIEVSGCTGSSGGLGRTTAQMHDPNTFIDAEWDFPGVGGPVDRWTLPGRGGYPVLAWLSPPWPALPTFAGGMGTASDPFLIATTEQLNSIADNPLLMDSHFALADDIALGGEPFWPIGSWLFPFVGTFDGLGRTVADLMIRRDAGDNVGMFGVVDGHAAQIRNLVLARPRIEAPTSKNVGALAGYVSAEHVTDCIVTDANVIGGTNVGGLIGSSAYVVSDCRASGAVSGQGNVGGLVGRNLGVIRRCAALCTSSGDSEVGGLIGRHHGEVVDSYSIGVTSGNDWVGGLAGIGDLLAEFEQCFSAGTVTGARCVGGLIGESWSIVTSCYAKTDVSGQSLVGGLVGETSSVATINQCYFAGSLVGQSEVGALVGSARKAGSVTSCFWDMTLAGGMDAIGDLEPDPDTAFGKTTPDMLNPNTFLAAGWDFENVWMICEGRDYPRLRWEGIACK